MANILDYIAWRGDLTMEQDGFNEDDGLILCRLSNLSFHRYIPAEYSAPSMTIREAAMEYFMIHGYLDPSRADQRAREDEALLKALRENRRYANMTLKGYVQQTDPVEE